MINEEILKKIRPGAKVKIFEGKTPFEGLVISRKHGSEPGATFTVRTIVAGVGVEKIYPVHSPSIIKAEVVSSPKKIHRSKLYFVRVTFVPATNTNLGKTNEARLIFKPTLADGIYEIHAQGIDRSKNDAGKYDYRIKFKVDSKPSITNILNYPNPFSTSTQFVFTLTGAAIPDQLTIQIFSASGKVVKEITRDQLGDLHIGTNVTSYHWDGTDNYGDRLANGVYFYRVMTTNMDGTRTEVKESSIDKYFKHGYGKLYIIR